MFNKCKKFNYDPLLSETNNQYDNINQSDNDDDNYDDDDDNYDNNNNNNLTITKNNDNRRIYWINRIIVGAFVLTLIMYRFYDCLELFNIKSDSNQIINNYSNELLIKDINNNEMFENPTTELLEIDDYNNEMITYQRQSRALKYYLYTSECQVPYVNPFTPAIRKIFTAYNASGCNRDAPFIKLWFDVNAQQYILHMDMSILNKYAKVHNIKNPNEKVVCCYRQILRSGSGAKADDKHKLLPCTNFHRDLMVPPHINSVIVDCSLDKNKFHQSVFYMVQVKNIQKNRKVTLASLSPVLAVPERRKPSIILIGIDTLSRINIRRTMPKTFKYLQEKNWFELLGYNKVGDNTFPNLMALLTGQDYSTVEKLCKPTKPGGLDKCNFIWKEFKKQGYYTAYAEDCESISTFNYIKKGFKRPPTDYYFRPTALAMEHSLKPIKKWQLNYCIANRQYGEYIYDVGIQFASRFHYEPHFGLFWTNSFSHNDYNGLSGMDLKILQYLRQFEFQGTIKNSIVMFLSDHGCRWGPLMEQPEEFLEQRLPIYFISLPIWFRNKYPKFIKQLQINQKRLTSPYDVYMTFQHILKLNDPKYKVTQASGCSTCQSLFDVIPENRTCARAGIPRKWCTCNPLKVVSNIDDKLREITGVVISKINQFIEKKKLTQCSKLSLVEITKVKTPLKKEKPAKILYIIDFRVSPIVNPIASFSANVWYNIKKNSVNVELDDILRTSLYEKSAKCVVDVESKKFCLCKNYHPSVFIPPV